MSGETNKILGENRRKLILSWLKEESEPLTGKEISERTNVSRQVIVQDISLLKATGEPIIATARGYIYLRENNYEQHASRVIVVKHTAEQTAEELYILVDHGVVIRNVMVEHPIYGDITGSLMLKNRKDVNTFLDELNNTGASLLSQLTEGVHLHTIEAENELILDEACEALRIAGILLED
ncbi:transcription repressor NadR [Ornithinibacillus bavariensis]|uniref:Transcriptional regulator n=1 Tax=Ornithinibacillus bavariensis TaxID=545502 RepID=A0A920C8R6_9BACI|nr:transcription repressor NadR [Ornithinibacillus bavariensis]GIO27882.1 transcriptional regulator [Ornithinibacillus bavariensis]HAM80341.1 transcription repressor NadR [Ornithinibacillus sp.]